MAISRPQNSFSKAVMPIQVKFLLSAFRREERGQVAVVLSLALLPMVGLVGAAVDYSRATSVRAQLQGAMDAAVLAGAKDGSSKWQTTALATFNANPPPSYVVAAKPSFSSAGTTYTGSVSARVPTALVKVIGFNSIAVSVTSVANGSPGAADNSCILALDHANSVSHLGMTFDGAPNVNLDKCSLRSNTSIPCRDLLGPLEQRPLAPLFSSLASGITPSTISVET
jgi:Flp pilus assembly protein TadG